MEEIKIYQQIDWNGFHIGTNADLVPGALDVEAPVYDSNTHKAKWVDNTWVIKPILEWDLKEGQKIQESITNQITVDPITNEEIITPITTYSVITVERLSKYHSWVNNEWLADETGITLCKNEKLESLALSRDTLLEDGIIWDGKLIKGREKDVSGILSVVIKLQMGLSSIWCYSSGEREEVTTLNRAKEIAVAINSLRQGAYVKCSILEETVNSATTIDDILAVVWN